MDQVFVVTASIDPAPIPQLIDRLLVVAEANEIAAAVVVNKVDLDPGTALIAPLRRAGYEVYATSVRTGEGMAEFAAALAGRISVVTGPSGAGKSSLLNRVQPGLKLRTGEISAKVRRGQEHDRLGGHAPARRRRLSGGHAWLQRGRPLGHRSGELDTLLSRVPARPGRLPLRRLPPPDRAGVPRARGGRGGAVARDRWESYLVLLEELESAPEEWE